MLQANAVPPDIHDALTERRRFNFKLGPPARVFTARAEQSAEPGVIRIFDIRDERPLII